MHREVQSGISAPGSVEAGCCASCACTSAQRACLVLLRMRHHVDMRVLIRLRARARARMLRLPGSSVNGSIMLTASHMPMHNNGLKFFTADGGLNKGDISTILDSAAAKCAAAGVQLCHPTRDAGFVLQAAVAQAATPATWDLLARYAGHLRQQIVDGIDHPTSREQPLTGLKIAVDAGNGSGGFFATEVRACVRTCEVRACVRTCARVLQTWLIAAALLVCQV